MKKIVTLIAVLALASSTSAAIDFDLDFSSSPSDLPGWSIGAPAGAVDPNTMLNTGLGIWDVNLSAGQSSIWVTPNLGPLLSGGATKVHGRTWITHSQFSGGFGDTAVSGWWGAWSYLMLYVAQDSIRIQAQPIGDVDIGVTTALGHSV